MPLPTFLIIGAQKCATRWLRHNLGLHPDVFVADEEVEFFDSNRRWNVLGTDWYAQQFAGWQGQSHVGEASPSYMMRRKRPRLVASRIKQALPDVRLIALLRNPVDRAQSALVHHMKRDRVERDARLLDVVRATPPDQEHLGLIAGGWYAASLQPYRQLFGDQLMVLLYDDVVADPASVYRRALEHIGADPAFRPDSLDQVLFSNRAGEDDALALEEREELYDYFRDDVAQLERMYRIDLSVWKPATEAKVLPLARVPIAWKSAAQWVEGRLRNVDASHAGNRTPCEAWSVQQVLRHLLEVTYLAAKLIDPAWKPAEEHRLASLPPAGETVADAYRDAAETVTNALASEGKLDEVLATPLGTAEARIYLGGIVIEQLVHGWDLAVSTGQHAVMPAAAARAARQFAERVIGEERRDDRFGPPLFASVVASPTEQLVAYLGRDVTGASRLARDAG